MILIYSVAIDDRGGEKMNSTEQRLPTHLFLAKLGKTILRPGGKEATNRILEACQLHEDSNVLEVATNTGATAIHIAKAYNAKVSGIDINKEAVQKANEIIIRENVQHLVQIQQGNATQLPFDDATFDVVINEAMLTMLPQELKEQALAEYRRVLKPGGILATHDLVVKASSEESVTDEIEALRNVIVVKAQPLSKHHWHTLVENTGFKPVDVHTGELHLVSLVGLIRDEGLDGLIRIIENARKNSDDEQYFLEIIEHFDHARHHFGHITIIAKKQG